MRYRLPAFLGLIEMDGVLDTEGNVAFAIPGGGTFWVERRLLDVVKPTLPEEPPVGTVVLVEAPAAIPLVFFRYPDGWAEPAQSTYYDWGKVNSYGTPVRYVPDPFAEPVELPWSSHLDHSAINVVKDDGRVLLEVVSGGRAMLRIMPPSVARELVRALMTAADAAEKEQS